MGIIFAVSSIGMLPSVDRGLVDQLMHWAGHLGEYAVLSFLLLRALNDGRSVTRREIVITLIVAAVYGLSDEWHQTFVPGRNGELWTVGLDTVGAAMGWMAYVRTRRMKDEG